MTDYVQRMMDMRQVMVEEERREARRKTDAKLSANMTSVLSMMAQSSMMTGLLAPDPKVAAEALAEGQRYSMLAMMAGVLPPDAINKLVQGSRTPDPGASQ